MRTGTKRAGLTALALVLAACGGDAASGDGDFSGRITIDGSSTVYPISQAMAEEFMLAEGRGVRVTVSQSGTGGGFRRFCAGETEISDASRPIKDEERQACEDAGVDPIQLDVARDGITLAVNPANDFVGCLTVEEIRRIWEPGSTVASWADVREEWPGEELKLYGPGTSSGTFDYFTEAIMGEEDLSRQDYTASEDDNVLVQGVAGDRASLGYFGFAYYEANQDQLRAVEVDAGDGCVAPTIATIGSGEYRPLSRPMFLYVDRNALSRPEVQAFLTFYLEAAPEMVPEVGYVPLDAGAYEAGLTAVRSGAPEQDVGTEG
ncbi:MAG TPA: PstS family phosphate ABC transporter substrate-binding protein [Longimicrobiales bacterium]|nr:PstS family phosphate ABC transporter substrate-binding protein [Longimicrobiales bacterium]